eukprot:Blabericola_migrator_1__4567@NODE_242_length_10949_cov_37_670281_g204_i0_p3_GENE_NODE_242_length_10949_cov_37_670281_g204_i0NODE_242_length_10949_cov_37_670281_g204_i0_p3_ORF_typecomplete_len284_score47_38_NODE_242_length_10949_cov_37_670281_g204_i042725123
MKLHGQMIALPVYQTCPNIDRIIRMKVINCIALLSLGVARGFQLRGSAPCDETPSFMASIPTYAAYPVFGGLKPRTLPPPSPLIESDWKTYQPSGAIVSPNNFDIAPIRQDQRVSVPPLSSFPSYLDPVPLPLFPLRPPTDQRKFVQIASQDPNQSQDSDAEDEGEMIAADSAYQDDSPNITTDFAETKVVKDDIRPAVSYAPAPPVTDVDWDPRPMKPLIKLRREPTDPVPPQRVVVTEELPYPPPDVLKDLETAQRKRWNCLLLIDAVLFSLILAVLLKQQ